MQLIISVATDYFIIKSDASWINIKRGMTELNVHYTTIDCHDNDEDDDDDPTLFISLSFSLERIIFFLYYLIFYFFHVFAALLLIFLLFEIDYMSVWSSFHFNLNLCRRHYCITIDFNVRNAEESENFQLKITTNNVRKLIGTFCRFCSSSFAALLAIFHAVQCFLKAFVMILASWNKASPDRQKLKVKCHLCVISVSNIYALMVETHLSSEKFVHLAVKKQENEKDM